MPRKLICSVHDEIIYLVEESLKLPFSDIESVVTNMYQIIDLTKEAKQMGVNMENGLISRKSKAEEYEATIVDLEKSLELANSDNKDLKDETEYLYNKLALCESQE